MSLVSSWPPGVRLVVLVNLAQLGKFDSSCLVAALPRDSTTKSTAASGFLKLLAWILNSPHIIQGYMSYSNHSHL